MIDSRSFPRLTAGNHRITSPPTTDYNCIAWSAEDTGRWWQPGVYWPIPADPHDCWLGNLVEAFQSLGYLGCDNGSLDDSFAKVALYAKNLLFYTHAARQLPSGQWTSKLGRAADIEHDTPDDLMGGVYGEVLQFMRRPTSAEAGETSPIV